MSEGPRIDPDLMAAAADVLEADGIVTCHNAEQMRRDAAAGRKAEQREREKAGGVEVFELKMSAGDRALLAEGQTARGSQGEPYTATEYILTLIRNDNQLLKKQRGKLEGRVCNNCQKPLPRGCGGTWARESRCLLARSEIALEL